MLEECAEVIVTTMSCDSCPASILYCTIVLYHVSETNLRIARSTLKSFMSGLKNVTDLTQSYLRVP
jgi:hypothetical protein